MAVCLLDRMSVPDLVMMSICQKFMVLLMQKLQQDATPVQAMPSEARRACRAARDLAHYDQDWKVAAVEAQRAGRRTICTNDEHE